MSKSLTVNPTGSFAWTDPATVPAGDTITGYSLGVRDQNAPGSAPGTYPLTVTVTGATANSESFAVAMSLLNLAIPGDYQFAVRSVGTVNGKPATSVWTPETTATASAPGTDFSLEPVIPLPPPTNPTIA